MFLKALFLSLISLVLVYKLPAVNSDEVSVSSDPQSREYKLLLEPRRFADPLAGVRTFREIVYRTARDCGLGISYGRESGGWKTTGVVYLDTEMFDLRNHNYILRKRTKRPRSFELSLKFRSPNQHLAAGADVQLAPGYPSSSPRFEQDTSLDGSNWVRVYSLSNRVKNMNQFVDLTLGGFAAIFPVLGTLPINPDSVLVPVNTLQVTERSFFGGIIDFGQGMTAYASIEIWYETGSENPLIGEFSFTIRDLASHGAYEQLSKADAFFTKLVQRTSTWKAPWYTKVSRVYETGAEAP